MGAGSIIEIGGFYPFPWAYGNGKNKKEGNMDIPRVYKALARYPDGRLVSLWASNHSGTVDRGEVELEYHEGEITYAPQGSQGIYTEATYQEGIGQMKNGEEKRDLLGATLVLHEAIPLGNMMPADPHAYQAPGRYPAILLGKEVWRKPAPEPIEEWVDVTGECTLQFINEVIFKKKGFYVQVYYRGACVVGLGLADPYVKDGFKLEPVTPNYLQAMSTFRILHRVVK